MTSLARLPDTSPDLARMPAHVKVTPYRIAGPALMSFSGGRTSAYMLHEILRAHGGALPDDVHVCFANTGKEREETLRFVHECGSRWNVRVRWIEWRDDADGFEEVGYNSASRAGEPFAALITKKNYLPNAVMRFCTQELKVLPMTRFMMSLGYERWANVVGLRYDEGHRVLKQLARNETGKERYTTVMPLSTARITRRDVMAFWAGQPFDLGLLPHQGNCDLCFLKGRGKLLEIIREEPDLAQWWIDQEASVRPDKSGGSRFVKEYCYADLAAFARDQHGFFDVIDDTEHDAECGLHCGAA